MAAVIRLEYADVSTVKPKRGLLMTATTPHTATPSPRRTVDRRTRRDRFFNLRGWLSLSRDRSGHRRYAALYDDLLS